MSLKREIGFVLNGVATRATVPVTMSALAMLREVLGLTGTKYACGEGECGACTIVVDGLSVCACLLFAVDCDGRTLATIEGGAGTDGIDAFLQPLEVALADLPQVRCTPEAAARLRHGNPAPVIASDADYGETAWASCRGKAVAIGTYRAGEMHPTRVILE